MAKEYSDIMNVHNLNQRFERMHPEKKEKLLDWIMQVTEKIHGDNFRVGVTKDGKRFIGTKSMEFYEFEQHPGWNRFTFETKTIIYKILDYIVAMTSPFINNDEIIFYGEMYGNGLNKKGFRWDFEGLKVAYIELSVNGQYIMPNAFNALCEKLKLQRVPVLGVMSLRDALALDIESMNSKIAPEPHIEGVVITPYDELPDFWTLDSRFIVKYKTKKYAEVEKTRIKEDRENQVEYVSPFIDFVTEARLEHGLQAMKEKGLEVKYHLSDLQYLSKEVIADIEDEENEGNELSKDDKRCLSKYIPQQYRRYLESLVSE